MFTSKTALLVLATIGAAWADTCALTAYNNALAAISLGGTKTDTMSGFLLRVNGGTPTYLKADKGNNFPPLYNCPDWGAGSYGYAFFSKSPKGRIGMCLTDIDDIVAGANFNCEDQGGKKSHGQSSSKFFGVGTAVGSTCTITFDC